MPTPAPHTPVAFLLKGGSAFFSVDCQNAILDLGWHPDEFGTYSSTLSYIQQCRAKVAAGEPCTPREQELGQPYYFESDGKRTVNPAAYTSGHMYMNATMQGSRGNDCTNRVDGYSETLCPSMPHQGQTHDAGTQHNLHTVREYEGALGPNGEHTAGGPYGGASSDAEAMQKAKDDAKARARQLVAEREEALEQQRREQARGEAADGPETEQAPAAGEASPARPGEAKAPTAPEDQQVTGGDAGECLENFVEMGFNGMQQQSALDVNANKAAAGDAEAAASGGLETLQERERSARAKLARATQLHAKGAVSDEELQAIREEQQGAIADVRTARGDGDPRAEAACRVAQGERVAAGQPQEAPTQPQIPGANVPGTQASSTGLNRSAR